ncbi:hypothetical protein H310_09374, partial [Aphanomyces invadans]
MDLARLKKKTAKSVQDKRESDEQLIREAALMAMKRKNEEEGASLASSWSPSSKEPENKKFQRIGHLKDAASVDSTFTAMMEESNRIKAEEVAMKKEELALEQRKLELEQA